jgi:hypothetical protein
MFQYLRDVCSTKLLSTPVELGGPGVIVQMLSVWLPFPLNSGMLDNCTHLLVVCVVHSSQ